MISFTKNLQQWCWHKGGVEKILNTSGWTSSKASAELNQNGSEIISSFGQREFTALVGFIDMRGFSALSQGKRPKEVQAIVAPFISIVVDAATKHGCFIDKTIGDEVMIVMPWFEHDTVLSDARLPDRKVPIFALEYLLRDLIVAFDKQLSSARICAGFAYGELILDRVGTADYGEWTVYGNCVNAAKRLQARKFSDEWEKEHVIVVGELEAERSDFRYQLDMWVSTRFPNDPLRRLSPLMRKEDFKGVGSIIFAEAAVQINRDSE
jgi:hypothetical protein